MTKPSAPCPCGLKNLYSDCCAPLHQGLAATTPQALMRSRYAAYVLNLEAYLKASWHVSNRPSEIKPEHGLKWLGLTVHSAWNLDDNQGYVEFTARYRVGGGRAEKLQETSRFVRENGQWFYVDGVVADALVNDTKA